MREGEQHFKGVGLRAVKRLSLFLTKSLNSLFKHCGSHLGRFLPLHSKRGSQGYTLLPYTH